MNIEQYPRYLLVLLAGFGCGIGVSRAAPVPVAKEGTKPFVEWRYQEPCGELTSPIICGNNVVVGTGDGFLRAFRVSDGKEVWQYQQGKRIYHSPSTDGTRIYFTPEDSVVAVNSDNGEVCWRVPIEQGCGPSLPDSTLGMVYVGGDDGNLYAFDSKTGQVKWKSDFVMDAPADPPGFPGKNARVGNKPARPNALATDGEIVFLSVFDQSRVIAFAPKTGKQLWSFQAGGWISPEVVFTKTHAFIGSQDKCLHCLEKSTGKAVWKFETKGRIESAATLDEAAAYVASCDGSMYAVSLKDGSQLWKFELDPTANGRRSAVYSTPILNRGSLSFAAGEGQFYSLRASDGQLRWKLRPSEGSELYCSPATHSSRYFVTSRPSSRNDRPRGPTIGEAALIAISLK